MNGDERVRLVALGGLGEIGMNCLVLEQGDDMMLIDCGVTFPTSDLGIDVFHPRFDYVLEQRDKVRGIVLTHGHEDHIGALPYLLQKLDVPVWGPAHAIELARHRLDEHGFDRQKLQLRITPVRTPYPVGSFTVEPLRVTHSIADATALAIRTRAGLVVHTGDFKLDPTPADGERTDEGRFEELGHEGVRLLLSDSTSIDAPGSAGSERDVGEALDAIAARAKTRLVIGMFASNVQRLTMLGETARTHGRRICLLGRSVQTHVRAAHAVGRLAWPSDLCVSPEVAQTLPRERLLVIASGTQAERPAALWRLATATHPVVRIEAGDVVVLSSRVIPGNDRAVYDLYASFLRLGVELITRTTDRAVHASGHAHRDEQARMLAMTAPRAFVPLHGTLHHLTRHAALAREAGVAEVVVAEDGDVLELGAETPLTKIGRATVGRVATYDGEELSDELLRERAQIGRAGMVMVSLVLDGRGTALAEPRIVSRGVLDHEDVDVTRKVGLAVARALEEAGGRARSADAELSEIVRLAARRAIEQHTGRRPIVTVALTRL